MRIQSVKSNRQNMHLPCKFLPLVWFILQRPPFFARKNGRIGTASDSLVLHSNDLIYIFTDSNEILKIIDKSQKK